jgi:hypothetical protein
VARKRRGYVRAGPVGVGEFAGPCHDPAGHGPDLGEMAQNKTAAFPVFAIAILLRAKPY